ncbi:MAG: methylated-DNA--[protein]-cysteine S-methyltransferase [Desulfitobacterium hafniense]|nr:methylated-DNA--[protein]-cysteine S-methyltransferase [Desulfitobacterium hafniense]
MLSNQLVQILEKRDWDSLRQIVRTNRGIIRDLTKRVYIKDGILFWRAVEAIGVAASELDKLKAGYSTELVRRYFWSLNEESGGTAWNSSEVIGCVMAYCPESCGHFNWMFSGLLEDPSLVDGVLWGLVQIVQNAPEIVEPIEERIRPFLYDSPRHRQLLAVLIYTLMQRSGLPQADKAGRDWSVPADVIASFLDKGLNDGKGSEVKLYHQGYMQIISPNQIVNPQIVYYCSYPVRIGENERSVTVASSQSGVCWLGLGSSEEEESLLLRWSEKWFSGHFLLRSVPANKMILKELEEYLAGQRTEFDIPLDLKGTPFQIKVWNELRNIPYGVTRSYEEMANLVGCHKGQRAVGMANNKNPIGIVVPCHRVIGKNGSLTGYAGGLDIKEQLLFIEKQ